jgi:hypothetical protein
MPAAAYGPHRHSSETSMLITSRPPRTTWETPDLSLVHLQTPSIPKLPSEIFGDAWKNWIAAAASAHGSPEDYIAASLLGVAGALIGNAREVEVGSFRQPPLLWMMLVGRPSSGKSPALLPFQTILNDLEDGIADFSMPGFWDLTSEHEPQLRIVDVTPAAAAEVASRCPKGLFLLKDELSSWFRRYGKDDFWLEAFMAAHHSVTRKGKPPIKIKRLAISVLGGCQPDPLRSFVEADVDCGFASRWLYVFPEPRVPGRSRSLDLKLPRAALRRLASLDLKGGSPVIKRLSRRAAERAETWKVLMHRRMLEEDGVVAGWLGKQTGTALRLALIIEYLWWAAQADAPEPVEISSRAYQAATSFIEDYATPMMLRTLNIASSPPEDREALALIRVLQRDRLSHFNARDLRRSGRALGLLTEPKVLPRACDGLEEAGLIRRLNLRAGDTPGRARADYEVNPVLL